MTISARAIATSNPQPLKPKKPRSGDVCHCCGQLVPNPRNAKRHRLLFGSLGAIFRHWPEGGWQPKDTEDLRAYLLIEAEHFFTKEHYIAGMSPKQIFTGMTVFLADPDVRKAKRFEELPNNGIRAIIPKSIAFNKLSETHFIKLVDKIKEIVETKVGVPFDDIIREHENEA